MQTEDINLKVDLVFTEVTFTENNEQSNAKAKAKDASIIHPGTMLIGFDIEVSLKINTRDGSNIDDNSIISSSRAGITLSKSVDVLKSIAGLSDLLTNPFLKESKRERKW